MKLGYHGTSLENALGILSNGYRNDTTMFWSVSTGNMHVFDEANYETAVYQSLNAAVIAPSLKRALVVVDVTNKKLVKDKMCFDAEGAYEIKNKIVPDDIVGIYVDEAPLHPLLKVIQKVNVRYLNKSYFNTDVIKLTKEEEEIFNLLNAVQVRPETKFRMKLTYKKDRSVKLKDELTVKV